MAKFKIEIESINPQGWLEQPMIIEKEFNGYGNVTPLEECDDWAYGYTDKGTYSIEIKES